MKPILMTSLLALAGLGLLAAATAASSGGNDTIPEATKAYWKKTCAKCHGQDGSGDTKMGHFLKIINYTDPKVLAKLKDEEMTKAIKEGVSIDGKKRMKAYGDKLDEQEIKSLIHYIRTFAKPS